MSGKDCESALPTIQFGAGTANKSIPFRHQNNEKSWAGKVAVGKIELIVNRLHYYLHQKMELNTVYNCKTVELFLNVYILCFLNNYFAAFTFSLPRLLASDITGGVLLHGYSNSAA